jgi:hypothetical protein
MHAQTTEIPYGYCQCGCGEKTKLAPCNSYTQGYVKGVPRAYVQGHNSRQQGEFDEALLRERFDAATDRSPGQGPDGDCHLWQQSNNNPAKPRSGRGRPKVFGKSVYASHVAWFLHTGDWPKDLGLLVLHRCDTPMCVRFEHLFLGTHADNAADRDAKGRAAVRAGEAHPQSKLTNAQRRVIAADTRLHRVIAAEHGVSTALVTSVKRRARRAE